MPTLKSSPNMPTATKTPLTTPPVEDHYGFYGTIKCALCLTDEAAAQAWADAMNAFTGQIWEPTEIAVRNFLRSRGGRHFADEVVNRLSPFNLECGNCRKAIQSAAFAFWPMQEILRQPADELFEEDPLASEYNG